MKRLAVLLCAAVPTILSADSHIQIEVACRGGGDPIAARVTMSRAGVVVIPVIALSRYCEAESGKPT